MPVFSITNPIRTKKVLFIFDEKLATHCINCMLSGEYNTVEELIGIPKNDFFELLLALNHDLKTASNYAVDLSNGSLSTDYPISRTPIIMSLKQLHSKLNHFNWNFKQISNGKLGLTMDFEEDLSNSFNSMIRHIHNIKIQYEHVMGYDKLTGLPNRDTFKNSVNKWIHQHSGEPALLMYCGLDNTESLNNVFGYEAGDLHIYEAAEIYRHFEKEQGIVSHIISDEFAIFVSGYGEPEIAMENMINKLHVLHDELKSKTMGVRKTLQASYGISFYPEDSQSVDMLIRYANFAMREVKTSSKGSILRFHPQNYSTKVNSFSKYEKLDQLIAERQIQFAFQPIVDILDNSIIGYEALMRSKLEDFISPLEILNIAKSKSKLFQLEQLTFSLLFQWLDKNSHKLAEKKIFFNTISSFFLDKKELLNIHPKSLELCKHVVFEILENTAEEPDFINKIVKLREDIPSINIAIDDYGNGYSSEARLLSLYPNIVKIDKFFVKNIEVDYDRQKFISNILSFCNEKKIYVVIEGVETLGELQVIKKLGIRYVQGYFFARPSFTLQTLDENHNKHPI